MGAERLELPDFVRECCAVLRAAGFEAYPVGGCVRDLLLGRAPEDWDVCTRARPEEIAALFSNCAATGGAFGTVTVRLAGGRAEVTPMRRESGYADGRHPDAVAFTADLREDLARRDFTVNAMALGADGAPIDPFGGLRDLRARRLRCVGDARVRFSEDGLRMLRCVRLAAQLEFEIAPRERRALADCAPFLRGVSPQRMRQELSKTLLSPRPWDAALFFSLGLLPGFGVPELEGIGQTEPSARARWAFLGAQLDGGAQLLETLGLGRRVLRAVEHASLDRAGKAE